MTTSLFGTACYSDAGSMCATSAVLPMAPVVCRSCWTVCPVWALSRALTSALTMAGGKHATVHHQKLSELSALMVG